MAKAIPSAPMPRAVVGAPGAVVAAPAAAVSIAVATTTLSLLQRSEKVRVNFTVNSNFAFFSLNSNSANFGLFEKS